MLLSSVIIILREVLEAALLFSVLIALSKQMGINLRWLVWSLLFGLLGAFTYGLNINLVSDWFDGVGQEVTNALIQLVIYVMLVVYMLLLSSFTFNQNSMPHMMKSIISLIMVIIISLAISREGAEIILYFLSVTHNNSYFLTVLVGMTIGASIGISIGLLFYYLLISLKPQPSIFIGLIFLLIVSAGMVSQASLLLIQADWLPSQLPLWDSSDFLSEKSVFGQLMYALMGYESTPTPIQAGLYLLGFILPISLIFTYRLFHLKTSNK